MFVEFDDVASNGCDVFINVAQLCPDRVRGGIGVEMTFPNDDLEEEDPGLSPIEDKLVRPEANFILSSLGEGVHKAEDLGVPCLVPLMILRVYM